MNTRTIAAVACYACLAAVLAAADGKDWPFHDHDAGGQRFSPLEQITPANVATLQPAWTFDTGVTGLQVTHVCITVRSSTTGTQTHLVQLTVRTSGTFFQTVQVRVLVSGTHSQR